MSKRKVDFYVNDEYHVFNRGVDKRKLFLDKGDLYYFFDAIQIANREKNISHNYNIKGKRKYEKEKAKQEKNIVEIIAYCILPNHFHFILREIQKGGITKFMQKLGTSYTMYFNAKYKRSGALFESRFKAVELDKDYSLKLTSAYVNLNYIHHGYNIKKDLVKSSIFEYLGLEKGELVCSVKGIQDVYNQFKDSSIEEYKKYIKQESKKWVKKHGNDVDKVSFEELEK